MDGKEKARRSWELTPKEREEFRRRLKAGLDRRAGTETQSKMNKGVNNGN